MRQAGNAPGVLAAANPPAVSAATGLGTGGGASVRVDDPSEGAIVLRAGLDATTGGSVTLKFASAPPTLFIAGHDGFGTVSVSGQGTTTVTVNWTGKLAAGEHRLAYEWATMK